VKRKLLVITAHPDDEAGNFGGTLAAHTDTGGDILLICLTGGEAARNRGTAKSNAELIALRREELARSCQVLGIKSHELWDYPDGGLQRIDFYAVTGRLVRIIREYMPEVVLTTGPEGGLTAHPDHGVAGLLATAAFHWAAQERYFSELGLLPHQPKRLFYGTGPAQPPHFPRVCLSPPTLVIDISKTRDRKLAAFHEHKTQSPLFERFDGFIRVLGSKEYFHLAAAEPGKVSDITTGSLFDE
jgi:LmbE family N-acetylglucosaminyl deacetylase